MWEQHTSGDGTANFYCAYDSAHVQVALVFGPMYFSLRVRHREDFVPAEVRGYDSAGMLGAALRSMGLPLPAPLRDCYAEKGYVEWALDERPASRPIAAALMGAVRAYRDITGSENVGDSWLTRSERERLMRSLGTHNEMEDAHILSTLWTDAQSPVAQYAR